ncbi:MAG: RNA polymerase subunit sigma-24 [Planctomycetia bacterium]|nr:RNA polymerase subunit sigma-24 [Planctomycetia bacterium]
MSAETSFDELLTRVRRGDADAAYQIVARYESGIRVAVRTRLSDPALRRQFDSIDVCQSVFASFFLRAAAGQYDLHDPAQLVALLAKMARKKLAMQSRQARRKRRDASKVRSLAAWAAHLEAKDGDPARAAIGRDLLRRAYELMDPEVREMAQLRADGADWSRIAVVLGGTPEGRRKQFRRGLDQTAELLGLNAEED